jgi:hypothetical protein
LTFIDKLVLKKIACFWGTNGLFFGVKMTCFEGENVEEMLGNKGFCVPGRGYWEHRPPGGSKRLNLPKFTLSNFWALLGGFLILKAGTSWRS